MTDTFGKLFHETDETLDTVPTPEAFALLVETLVSRYKISYFDAILEICEHYDREIESVKALLSPKLKFKLTEEAASRRLLKDKSFLQDRLDQLG